MEAEDMEKLMDDELENISGGVREKNKKLPSLLCN